MRLNFVILAGTASLFAAACSSATGLLEPPGYAVLVRYESALGTTEKYGVSAVSDQGRRLFSPTALTPPKTVAQGGGTHSYGSTGLPEWVRVTWRKPIHGKMLIPSSGKVIDTIDYGEIVGDHTVVVASRIPTHVLQYASQGKGRAIYLVFRIKDEGVLLSWSVQETVRDRKTGGTGRVYSLHGGDLSCDDPGGLIQTVSCTAGYLQDAPWYNPSWEFM